MTPPSAVFGTRNSHSISGPSLTPPSPHWNIVLFELFGAPVPALRSARIQLVVPSTNSLNAACPASERGRSDFMMHSNDIINGTHLRPSCGPPRAIRVSLFLSQKRYMTTPTPVPGGTKLNKSASFETRGSALSIAPLPE